MSLRETVGPLILQRVDAGAGQGGRVGLDNIDFETEMDIWSLEVALPMNPPRLVLRRVRIRPGRSRWEPSGA